MKKIGYFLCFAGGAIFGIIAMSLLFISSRESRLEERKIKEKKKVGGKNKNV